MKRTDIIQSLINKIGAENYLEVGVSAGENFRDIKCKNKVGVDPEPSTPATIHTDSDSFFKDNKRIFDEYSLMDYIMQIKFIEISIIH